MTQDFAIVAQGLIKNYGPVTALHGVNLEVQPGEIFGFLGPNGAGKTTTIRCCLDLIRPDKGYLRVLDLDPQKDSVRVRKRCGYLPGELHFEDSFTVGGLFHYLDELRSHKTEWHYVHKLAERIDLDLKPQIKNLSKGNKQKVGIIQAFMHRPELLLLDEPTLGLDPLIQHEVLQMIVEASHAGTTIFFSSHIISEVQEIAKRVAIIRAGAVVEVADTLELINRTVRRVDIRFSQAVDPTSLRNLPGVKVLSPLSDRNIHLQIEGEMDQLIKTLAAYPVSDFETERPTLEEVFMAYYEKEK